MVSWRFFRGRRTLALIERYHRHSSRTHQHASVTENGEDPEGEQRDTYVGFIFPPSFYLLIKLEPRRPVVCVVA